MKFLEPQFRSWARGNDAYFELAPFAEALSKSSPEDEDVIVTLLVNGESRPLEFPREDVVNYVRWIEEEAVPERELLEYVKPEMRPWITQNRSKMSLRLKAAIAQKPEHWDNVVIVWETATPDAIPLDIAKAYAERYK